MLSGIVIDGDVILYEHITKLCPKANQKLWLGYQII